MTKHQNVRVMALLLILLTLSIMPSVVAQNRIESGQTNIQSALAHRYQNLGVEHINAVNYTPDSHFRNILDAHGYPSQGLYWGHGLPAYYIDHQYYGHSINFSFNYTFTHQDIETGALGYWIRIPVNGVNVQEALIFNGSWYGGTLIARANQSIHNEYVIWDYTGIYMFILDGLYVGHRQFNFLLYPKSEMSIGMWVGNEDYSSNYDTVSFYRLKYMVYQSGVETEIVGYRNESYPGCPTVDLLFVSGLDRGGYSSLRVPAGKILHYGYHHSQNDTYPSIYLPFYSEFRTDFIVKFSCGRIDGRVGYHANYIADRWGFENPTAPGNYAMFNNVSCENVTDFLLVSSSWPLVNNSWGPPSPASPATYCWIQIQPSEDIIVFIAPNTQPTYTVSYISNLWDNRSIFYFNNNRSVYDLLVYPSADCFDYHVYMTATQNDGVWAKTYNYSGTYIIDTGWAKGTRLPGETVVWIAWDSGRSAYFNGTVQEFRDLYLNNPMSWPEAFKSGFKGAVSWYLDEYWDGIGDYDFSRITELPENIGAVADEMAGSMKSGLIGIFQLVWRFLEDNYQSMVSLINILPWFIAVFVLEGSAYSIKNSSTMRQKFREMKETSTQQIERGKGYIDRYVKRGGDNI
jgi:hypothetical protein